MKQFKEYIAHDCSPLKNDTHVLWTNKGKAYKRKIQYKYFSNYPIEYIVYDGKQLQVNAIKHVSTI